MEDFATRTYGTSGLDNRPLFGETSAKDRIINLVVGGLTTLLILVTLIYWYRQGDLEPKFRNLIYYILFSIIMLCICANLYFHDVGR
nr:transmembrane protein 243 isoform X2 [Rattus norvegicus]|eukprot:XP_006236064.1 PREDICTED: transmembrane protein 243 isoform X1 [Rattus norvegicus]